MSYDQMNDLSEQ